MQSSSRPKQTDSANVVVRHAPFTSQDEQHHEYAQEREGETDNEEEEYPWDADDALLTLWPGAEAAQPPVSAAALKQNGKDNSEQAFQRRMLMGPNKAGTQVADRDHVAKVIYDASKGSRFFNNEKRKDAQTETKVRELQAKFARIREMNLAVERKVVQHQINEIESRRDLSRWFVHVDMDAFYAAVEERKDPRLKTLPVGVGGEGMLCTANYEARKYGVRAAMPGYIARKLCPRLVIVPLDFPLYRSISAEVGEIFSTYDPDYAAMSLDEAYLDITTYMQARELVDPAAVVQELRARITEKTQLTASAGIGANRMIAKICSDMHKPNGQMLIPRTRAAILEFLRDLPIRKIGGIGKFTERVLHAADVTTVGQLRDSLVLLYKAITPKQFTFLLRVALGVGHQHVDSDRSWERKSISTERTFSAIHERSEMQAKLRELSESLAKDLEAHNLKGRGLTLRIKTIEFARFSRARVYDSNFHTADEIFSRAKELLNGVLREVAANVDGRDGRGYTESPSASVSRGVGDDRVSAPQYRRSSGGTKVNLDYGVKREGASLAMHDSSARCPHDAVPDAARDIGSPHFVGSVLQQTQSSKEETAQQTSLALESQIASNSVPPNKHDAKNPATQNPATRNEGFGLRLMGVHMYKLEKQRVDPERPGSLLKALSRQTEKHALHDENDNDNDECDGASENHARSMQKCPVCNDFQSRNARRLQIHVEACLSPPAPKQPIAQEPVAPSSKQSVKVLPATGDMKAPLVAAGSAPSSVSSLQQWLQSGTGSILRFRESSGTTVPSNPGKCEARAVENAVCPLCAAVIVDVTNVKAINDHIDECLATGAS